MNEHRKVVGRPSRLGVSGNPGGRPKELRDIIDLARSHAPEAIESLAQIMTNLETQPAARVAAANAILDRGFGKPRQSVEVGQQGRSWAEIVLEAHAAREVEKAPDRGERKQG